MRYYKIVREGRVAGAGILFLKWFPRAGRLYSCDFDEAQAVQDVVTETFYTADWLRNLPGEAPEMETAEVVLIGAAEYDELLEQLRGGEEIHVPEPEPGETLPLPEEQDPEAPVPMTVQQMRDKIEEMDAVLSVILGVME